MSTELEQSDSLPYVTMNYLRTGEVDIYAYPSKDSTVVKDGDLVLLWDGSKAGEFMLAKQGILGSTLVECRNNRKLDDRFAYYACKSVELHIQKLTVGMGIPHVNGELLKNTSLAFPRISEQHTIADFLDRKTTHIEALIAAKERQIELLQEKREVLINHAVTKGLNPDASMKDTDIKWLGKIPDHWEVAPFKRLTNRIDVGIAEAATHAYCDEGIPIIRSTNIRPNKIITDDLLHIKEWFAEKNKSKYLLANDLVTVRTGAPGTTAVVPHELHNSQCFTLLISTLKPSQDSRYYSYFMNSSSAKYCFAVEGWGAAQINISVPIMQQLIVVKPPRNEQRTIADYLDQKTSYYDKLVMKIQESIEKLREYHMALVSATATGKIDVRKEVP